MIDYRVAKDAEEAKAMGSVIEKFQGFVIGIAKDGAKGWVVWFRARRQARLDMIVSALVREGYE
jgi:hypothetical protein